MTEQDKFYFLEGLKPWARIELQRQKVQDVTLAMTTTECLIDYSDNSNKKETITQEIVA